MTPFGRFRVMMEGMRGMTSFEKHPAARWAVPAVVVAAIAGGSLVVSRTAEADSGLAPITAQQLLVDLQQAGRQPMSGTVDQTVDLGLPSLSGISGLTNGRGTPGARNTAATSTLTSLVSGSHTWRVWAGDAGQSRLALVDGNTETALIRNGTDVWLWSSADKTAAHGTLSADAAKHGGAPASGNAATDLPRTPQEAATRALTALDPSTKVTTSGTANVAGRDAYELVLAPKPGQSRVAQVRIAMDAEKKVPLRVQVYSTKLANPAIDVGFTSVDFAAPDASMFAFTPPKDATVKPLSAPGVSPKSAGAARPAKSDDDVKVVGKGWSAVAVGQLPAQAQVALRERQVQSLLASFPKASGSWGSGRVVDGTLFTVVLTDDGRVAVGAVAPDAVYSALAAT